MVQSIENNPYHLELRDDDPVVEGEREITLYRLSENGDKTQPFLVKVERTVFVDDWDPRQGKVSEDGTYFEADIF